MTGALWFGAGFTAGAVFATVGLLLWAASSMRGWE
jgi:hypothetical protein